MTEKITKDMKIGEILQKHGYHVAEVMLDHGLHCIGCCGAAFESLEQGCKTHGLDDEKIDKLVDDLNKAVEEKAKQPKESCGPQCGCGHEEKEEKDSCGCGEEHSTAEDEPQEDTKDDKENLS